MRRFWHSIVGHEWKLERGFVSQNQVALLRLGGHSGEVTTYTKQVEGGLNIWGWTCPCGARKPATRTDVVKSYQEEAEKWMKNAMEDDR